ncbi:hypothetical protein KDK77_09910 [bacterium]|nr:hypothetical protein [bacterium]MCP5462631.1 hypothetical protein [bacterium]
MTLYPSYYARNDFSEAGWNDFYLNVLRNAGVKNIKSETMVRRQNRIFRRWLRRRTKRCIYSNNDFEVFKNYGVSGVYVKRFQDVWIGSDPISIIERLFQNSDSFYKNSNTTAVGNFKLNNEMVVIKKFKVKRWFNPLKNMLRTSRGRRTWMFGWHLVLQKVPVPQPVFYFEKRVRRLLYENYLGMMYYAHSMPVDKFLLTQTRFNHREFINECASLCRKITESTVYHGDFQLKNILVRYDNGTFSFCIIDLDSIVMSNMNQSKKMEGMLRHLKKSYLRLDTPNTFTKRELMRFCILAFKNVPDKKNVIRRFLKVE